MTDFDKLDQQYRDEGWGHITDDALPGVRPSNVESQARAVATWCVGRIAALEAQLEVAIEQCRRLEALVEPHIKWDDALEATPPAPKVTEAMGEAGRAHYSEGGCVGLGEHEVLEVVESIIIAALSALVPHPRDTKTVASHEAQNMRDKLSTLEDTPPTPKVTEGEAGAKLANAMWGITLTAAQESGE